MRRYLSYAHKANTDSQTLGGLLNINKGFSLTKGRKEKRKGEKKEKRWEKPTFLKEWSRSKAFYSQRRLNRGVTTVSPPESWKVSSDQPAAASLTGGGRTMRFAEVDPWMECKNGDRAMQQENSPLQIRTPAWASEPTRLLQNMFSIPRKSASTSHEAQTIRQQHDTINQNQTSRRVFVGSSKLCNVPQRRRQLKRLTLAVWKGEGMTLFHPRADGRTKWFSLK